MKQWLHAFAMCQSMFCVIPQPFQIWDENARDKMLLCLPAVGLEIGLIWWMLSELANFLGVSIFLRGLIIGLVPLITTGYMHLDGFLDVTDAVRSYRSLERRREILKDSHVGAFAVIGFGIFAVSQYACAVSIPETADFRVLIGIPVISRCCSVLAVGQLPKMETSQYVNHKGNISSLCIPAICILLVFSAGAITFWKYCLVFAAELIGYALALFKAFRSLKGMNGDISGYSLVYAELAALAAFAIL